MWWKILLFAGMSASIVLSYMTPAPQREIGEASRIFYYHIPQAWICVLAFAVAFVYSVLYLKTRRMADDDKAMAAAVLGLVFCILSTITGSVFARVTWGSFWNWDPRETSIFVLLLIYGAYMALRGGVEAEEKRAALAAAYAIFAFVTVPLLVFVAPRVVPSLHPADSIIDKNLELTMGGTVGMIFSAFVASFTVLFIWIFSLANRVQALARAREERGL